MTKRTEYGWVSLIGFVLGCSIGLYTGAGNLASAKLKPPAHSLPIPTHGSPIKNISERGGAGSNDPVYAENVSGDSVEEWQSLLSLRGKISPEEWRRRRDSLFARYRPYARKDYLAASGRWADPDGKNRLSLMALWRSDPTGARATTFLHGLPDRQYLHELTANTNLAGDWVATADYYASVADIGQDERSHLEDLVITQWVTQEGSEVAAVWLKPHAHDPQYDRARIAWYTVSKSPAGVDILEQMSNARDRQLAIYMRDAMQTTN